VKKNPVFVEGDGIEQGGLDWSCNICPKTCKERKKSICRKRMYEHKMMRRNTMQGMRNVRNAGM
jgi:hypothetical protein